ncbi:MAG: hypothetical protein CBB94_00015 [Gammaproteobacteria bacterium TMED34]|nr:MAG: hypothetical protein CBB94_00015 [Gammaproteobacteria bacterium TMED34]
MNAGSPFAGYHFELSLAELPEPEPSLGAQAYHAEREKCLNSDPKRRANYEAYLTSSKASVDVNYLPVKLDIENVSRCNFRCPICPVSKLEGGKRAKDMSLDELKTLIDEQYGLVEVKLQGLGEPTIQGEPFFEMIRYIRSKYIWVRTASNASLLHLNDNYKALVDSGVNEVQISIDGATKKVFESIRPGSNFPQVIKNCEKLNDYAVSQSRNVTKAWCVVQKQNFDQLMDTLRLIAGSGFQSAVFAFDILSWGDESWTEVSTSQSIVNKVTSDLCHSLLELANQMDVKVGFWFNQSKYNVATSKTRCPWPFERAVVTSDSRLVPCCKIAVPEHYEIGTGSDGGLAELWNSYEYREFRHMHISGNLPKVCKACYSNS